MQILSHGVTDQTLAQIVSSTRQRIIATGDLPQASVEEQLAALDDLLSCDLGRFVLEHKGVNGFWAEYVGSYPARKARGETAGYSAAEVELLETPPITRATQDRYEIFRVEIQKRLRPGSVCASLPCGLMTDLLLQPRELAAQCRLVGIDLDPEAISQAKAVALTHHLLHCAEFRVEDAWSLPQREEFDLLSSNALNVYVKEDERVEELYRGFYAMLKPGGVLITSTLVPGPQVDPDSPWNMEVIDPEHLRRQALLFAHVIQVGFMHQRSMRKTRSQLEAAGFGSVEFILDRQGIFPTVIATK